MYYYFPARQTTFLDTYMPRHKGERRQLRTSETVESGQSIRPLELPKYVDTYAGREFREGVLAMAQELDIYEKMITEQHIPVAEVVEYLGLIDFFQMYPSRIEGFARGFFRTSQQRVVAMVEKESYTYRTAQEKILKFADEILQIIERTKRPLVQAVFAETVAVAFDMEDEDGLRSLQKRLDEQRATSVPSQFRYDDVEEDDEKEDLASLLTEKEMASLRKVTLWSEKIGAVHRHEHKPKLARLGVFLRQFKGSQAALQVTEADRERREGDDMAASLICIDIEPGIYPLKVSSFDWIKEITLERKGNEGPLLLGRVNVTYLNQRAMRNDMTWFNISHFNGDLNQGYRLITPVSREFRDKGIEDMYYDTFRYRILNAIVEGITDGSISMSRESQDERDDVEKIAIGTTGIGSQGDDVTSKQENSTPLSEILSHGETPLPQSQSRQEGAAETSSAVVFEERGKKKLRMSRNITRDEALQVLIAKFNVIESPGSKHLKLTREVGGKKIVIPMPNEHSSGAARNFPYILRRIVKFLQIDWTEFCHNL